MASKGYVLTATIASVSRLIDAACPSAVVGFVVSVYVNAVNGGSGKWTRPHVADECVERRLPFMAYANAATAVVLVIGSICGTAAHAHVHPAMVFGAEAGPASVAVFQAPLGSDFSEPATATLSATTLQLVAVNCWTDSSAVTSTFPVRLQMVGFCATENGQAIEFATNQIDEGCHFVSVSQWQGKVT